MAKAGVRMAIVSGVCLFSLLINSQTAYAAFGNTPFRYPVLPACTRYEYNLFEEVDFSKLGNWDAVRSAGDVGAWINQYHSTVGAVIDEHFSASSPSCTGDSYSSALAPKPALSALAQSLPSWNRYTWQYPLKDTDGDGNPGPADDNGILNENSVSQLDAGSVLMEYLQMYECALIERSLFLPKDTQFQEERRLDRLIAIMPPYIKVFLSIFSAFTNAMADRKNILDELKFARKALNRALYLNSGFVAMMPMETEIGCFQQASMDVRNAFGLAADTASCLPRIWYSKDPLRDYKALKPDEEE
ncbi:MAG: hypothetical protein UX30_C0004G0055 [Candidatus Saccharibacteria bacterium GW2011_GWA2_46_10]|nr:MAG: hypothetical protein UX30_C0004G0055 [Candidatus Saccharibacteria bacterium GW2011_GWA2_46_10]